MSSLYANWSFPTSIRFGVGRIRELAEACRDSGVHRPLLVTDRGLAKLPIASNALEILADDGLECGLYSEVDPNPSELNLAAGLETFRQGEFDGVVAFGGGSGIDLGKMIAFMVGQTRPIWDFEDVGDWWTRADAAAIAPIVAVPTTAGTGSEVGRASVITNSETRVKKIIFHPRVLPTAVISDPELTVGMPPAVTAGTGMDAFAHCLEAYCSPNFHPMCQGIALEGLRLVKNNLQRAFVDGADMEARANMMSAASMGAVAFQKGLGAIHAISHPVGSLFGTHHGTTNAVVIPQALEFNRSAIEGKIELATAYLGIEGGFEGFLGFCRELTTSLNIPTNLTALGAAPDRIEEMAKMALDDPSAASNPVPMTYENTLELYRSCL
ncbi:MAG: iron-containing alcohol dehydrogenase [Rhodobacteraceae bacterium]|nr:iron-containing alcohol dehydrogenase [Paracoccaceae bacterium]